MLTTNNENNDYNHIETNINKNQKNIQNITEKNIEKLNDSLSLSLNDISFSNPKNTNTCPNLESSKSISKLIVGEKLGKGTFGFVRIATHSLTGEKIAIKIFDKLKIIKENDKTRLEHEIKALKQIRHPNLLHLYSVIQSSKTVYLITEYIDGIELFEYIQKRKKIKEIDACKIFQQIISGIEYLSKIRISHRDIKTENILINKNLKIKIIDFGLCNTYNKDEFLKTACGTPGYTAPEMLKGEKYNGVSVDLWSCGIVLFYMICGYMPFEDYDPHELNKKIVNSKVRVPMFVSNNAKDLINKLLIKNPLKRITIPEIKLHPWFNQIKQNYYEGLILSKFIIPVDDNIINIMVKNYNYDDELVRKNVLLNKHNDITTSYYLLLKKNIKNGMKSVSDLTSKEFEIYIKDSRNLLENYDYDMEKVCEKRQKGWDKIDEEEYISPYFLEESDKKNENISMNKYRSNKSLNNKNFKKNKKQNLINLNIYMESRNDKLIVGNDNNNKKFKKINYYFNNKNITTKNNINSENQNSYYFTQISKKRRISNSQIRVKHSTNKNTPKVQNNSNINHSDKKNNYINSSIELLKNKNILLQDQKEENKKSSKYINTTDQIPKKTQSLINDNNNNNSQRINTKINKNNLSKYSNVRKNNELSTTETNKCLNKTNPLEEKTENLKVLYNRTKHRSTKSEINDNINIDKNYIENKEKKNKKQTFIKVALQSKIFMYACETGVRGNNNPIASNYNKKLNKTNSSTKNNRYVISLKHNVKQDTKNINLNLDVVKTKNKNTSNKALYCSFVSNKRNKNKLSKSPSKLTHISNMSNEQIINKPFDLNSIFYIEDIEDVKNRIIKDLDSKKIRHYFIQNKLLFINKDINCEFELIKVKDNYNIYYIKGKNKKGKLNAYRKIFYIITDNIMKSLDI